MGSGAFPVSRSTADVPPLASGTAARLGRVDAEVVSISAEEARVRHCGALKAGTQLMLSYADGARRVQMMTLVRSCRVLALGGGAGGATLYETLVGILDDAGAAGRGNDRS